MQRRCNGGTTEVLRRCNGGTTEVLRRCNGVATMMQRRCNVGATVSGGWFKPAKTGEIDSTKMRRWLRVLSQTNPRKVVIYGLCLRKPSQLWENCQVADVAKRNVATFRARSVSPTSRAHCGVHAHELIVNVQYLAPTRPSETPQPVGGNYDLGRKEAAHRVAQFK